MKVSNINNCLNSINTDEKVGVKVAFLTGDEKMSVFAIELTKGQFIPAHYHKKDIETYFILNGYGIVYTGTIENNNILWNPEKEVNTGDCFTIYPGEIHGFKNISEETLRIIATAPLIHSQDDRYFIETQKSPNR